MAKPSREAGYCSDEESSREISLDCSRRYGPDLSCALDEASSGYRRKIRLEGPIIVSTTEHVQSSPVLRLAGASV